MGDVGGQWRLPMMFKRFQNGGAPFQHEQVMITSGHGGLNALVQQEHRASPRGLAGAHMGQRRMGACHPFDQQLDLAARFFFPEQSCLDDFGVVENQQVALAKQGEDVCEFAVVHRPLRIHVQQSAVRA